MSDAPGATTLNNAGCLPRISARRSHLRPSVLGDVVACARSIVASLTRNEMQELQHESEREYVPALTAAHNVMIILTAAILLKLVSSNQN